MISPIGDATQDGIMILRALVAFALAAVVLLYPWING